MKHDVLGLKINILVPDRCFGFTKSIFISGFKGAFWLAKYFLYSKQES